VDFIASADEGDDPGRQRACGSSGPFDGRDLLLDAFAQGDTAEKLRPNAWFGMVVSDLSGADGSCPGASDGEVFGLLSAWAAQDAWVEARATGRRLLRTPLLQRPDQQRLQRLNARSSLPVLNGQLEGPNGAGRRWRVPR
jgi:hypothetical protein